VPVAGSVSEGLVVGALSCLILLLPQPPLNGGSLLSGSMGYSL
jgi:hypothetical protein